MSLQTVIELHHSTLELNGNAGAAAEKKECQRSRETISFLIVGEHCEPSIHIIGRIFYRPLSIPL